MYGLNASIPGETFNQSILLGEELVKSKLASKPVFILAHLYLAMAYDTAATVSSAEYKCGEHPYLRWKVSARKRAIEEYEKVGHGNGAIYEFIKTQLSNLRANLGGGYIGFFNGEPGC